MSVRDLWALEAESELMLGVGGADDVEACGSAGSVSTGETDAEASAGIATAIICCLWLIVGVPGRGARGGCWWAEKERERQGVELIRRLLEDSTGR